MERDTEQAVNDLNQNISTHTLTWSVTFVLGVKDTTTNDFNSHAHVERDVRFAVAYAIQSYFNSHAHVERDSGVTFIFNQNIDFNSHAHVERDTAVILPLER